MPQRAWGALSGRGKSKWILKNNNMLIKERNTLLRRRGFAFGLIRRERLPIILKPGLSSLSKAAEFKLGGANVSDLRLRNKDAWNHLSEINGCY